MPVTAHCNMFKNPNCPQLPWAQHRSDSKIISQKRRVLGVAKVTSSSE